MLHKHILLSIFVLFLNLFFGSAAIAESIPAQDPAPGRLLLPRIAFTTSGEYFRLSRLVTSFTLITGTIDVPSDLRQDESSELSHGETQGGTAQVFSVDRFYALLRWYTGKTPLLHQLSHPRLKQLSLMLTDRTSNSPPGDSI